MRSVAFGSLLAGLFLSSSVFAAAYVPPPGYGRTPESFTGDVFAVAPGGQVAVATNNDPNVRVYPSAAAAQAGTSPLTINVAGAKFWGDLTFADNNTLLISENSGVKGVLSYNLSSSVLINLGSVPDVQGIVAHNGAVYAVAANGPGTNAVYRLSGGAATPVLSNIGAGYAGGIAFDASGNLLVTDSNDPTFSGAAGKLLRYDTALAPLTAIDLAGGHGSDAYDVALDSEGDMFVTTNATLTEIPHGSTTAQQFGSTFGNFSFISGLDFTGAGFTTAADTGKLWINAGFGDDGAIIGVQTPEPASLTLIGFGAAAFLLRRRRRAIAASSLMILAAAVAIEGSPRSARADQFFATQVISTTVVGTPASFTNPALALGAPHGEGIDAGSTDVYSLTPGGSLTLGFDDANPASHRYITDGPGPDFIVSENAFFQNQDPHRSFAELMFVEVSTDGTNFQRFTNYSSTPAAVGPFGVLDPDNVAGFAGVNPVFANAAENSIDPFQVGAAGGDVFDLSTLQFTPLVQGGIVDLQHIRFVRLIDVVGDGTIADSFGRPIYDPTGSTINGADVDAVTVINGVHAPEPTALASVVTAAMVFSRWRA